MTRNGRQICVVGLGHFGAGLARSLARHCEVLALDSDIIRVNAIADDVQRALCLDARNYSSLASAVSSHFDEAVVSIGESLEASILCTLHLRRIGVPVIRAKANSADHAAILRAVGAEHIVFPEQETAERLALQMLNPNLLDFIPLAKDYRVMDIAAPTAFCGRSLLSLQIRNRFGLFVIAIKKHTGETFEFLPGPDHVIAEDDVLVMIGRESDIVSIREEPGRADGVVTRNGRRAPGGGIREPRPPDGTAPDAATGAGDRAAAAVAPDRVTGGTPDGPAVARAWWPTARDASMLSRADTSGRGESRPVTSALKAALGVIAGIALAFALVVLVEWVSAIVHPIPPDFDGNIAEHVRRYPHWGLAVVVLAWGATAAAATWLASRIGRRPAGIIVALVLAWAITFNLAMLPYPVWFRVVMPCAFAAACLLGVACGTRGRAPAARS